MALQNVGPAGVTVTSPPARELLTKVAYLEAIAADAVGFAAFKLPKYAFIAGIYTICTGANASQSVNVGFTLGGVELLNAFAPNSTGYAAGGAQTGTSVGTQLTEDKTVYVKASATLTTPVYVKVEYYIPPVGMAH
jgi:hypothetical protein